MDELYLFKSQDEGNRLLYAYYKGEFWFYDPNVQQWYISGHVREQYELEAQKDISLTPDDFICTGYGYELVAEYEVPVAALDALWAAKKVLPPEPASACLCETCTCTGCHEACFGHCQGCGNPVDHCNSYQTEGEKRLPPEPVSAEAPETADDGGEPEDGFPDWGRPMVEAFLQFDFIRGLPAFTASAFKNSEPVQHHQGGSLAGGLYDTGPKGIKFSVFRGDNSDQYREASYTWAGFVRRCKAAGLAPEPLTKDKEDVPCKTETPAPTGAAAATTDGSAAVSTAGTTTTSASGEGARNSPNSPSAPADTSAQSPKAADAVPSTRTTARAASGNGLLPAFDYTGLNVVTVDTLHLAENIIRSARQKYIVDLAGAVDMAHEELVRNSDGHNQHTEETFVAWCRSVGISKTTAYQLLQVQALITGATPEEQAVLEAASPSLLYAAAKPSAPAELVQAVKDGDITTHKQYQDLLARYNAEKSARQQAEQERDEAATHIQAARDMQIDTARERDTALRRAAEAEKQRDGARDALAAAKLRGDKLKAENDALKAQPVEAKVIDEEEVDRRAQARAAELTAPLREELEALRSRHPADPEEAEQAIRDAYDSAVYTGRVIESAWRSLCPLLPRMDADRRELALRQIDKIISTIQEECIKCL